MPSERHVPPRASCLMILVWLRCLPSRELACGLARMQLLPLVEGRRFAELMKIDQLVASQRLGKVTCVLALSRVVPNSLLLRNRHARQRLLRDRSVCVGPLVTGIHWIPGGRVQLRADVQDAEETGLRVLGACVSCISPVSLWL
jgi:hypothetical protein